MNITEFESNISIIKEFGTRIKKYRISQNKTQEDVSIMTGISIQTIKSVESGKGCSLDTLIKILKALNLCSNLNELVPELSISPNDYAKLKKERQRTRKRKESKIIIWGEDK